ncbi:uncharacterized protein [Malus domestica]|uniref:uncharacterized protein n=1 Tax=Malus domestica TaxID=3750 RepID=UPI0039751794
MDRNAFAILCDLLQTRGGLVDDGHVTIEEQVATFVNILGHHNKNRSIQVRFIRFGETISRYVHRVLRALLSLQNQPLSQRIAQNRDANALSWEGSATDSRVLGDAVTKANGLKVPTGKIDKMYMAVDPEENARLAFDELPIGEDLQELLAYIETVESSQI